MARPGGVVAKYAEVVVPGRSAFPLPDMMGQPFKVWFDRLTADLDTRIVGEIRVEMATGRLSVRPDFLLEFFSRTVTALDALIRTYMNRVQNFTIREIALASLADFRWVQISILDSRTTVICRLYSQLVWTKEFEPVDHDQPFKDGAPRHWNCRSLIVPVLPNDDLREIGFDEWLTSMARSDRERLFGANRVKLFERGLVGVRQMVI